MEKHITLVGVFTIVYRSLLMFGGAVILVLGGFLEDIVGGLSSYGAVHAHEIPVPLLHLVQIILVPVGAVIVCISVVGIIGAVGLLQKKEWGRIIVLIVSFVNLLHVPLGTILGAYGIWVLMNDETVRLCAARSPHSA